MSYKSLFSAYSQDRKYTIRHRDTFGNIYYETRQDCEPIVEFVKAAKDAPKDREYTHIAEVPMTVIGQWMRDGCLDDEKHIRRWINDPDNRKFRVYEGHF